jgi:hypothetical protein
LRNPAGIKDALTEYQAKAAMSEKVIAQKSLSTVDSIDAQVKMISQTLLSTLSGDERSKVLSLGGGGAVESTKKAQTTTTDLAKEVKKEIKKPETWDSIFPKPNIDLTQDGFFGDGRKRLMTGKGEMFNFIEDDQALFAPNLDEKLGVLKSAYLKLKQLNVSESLDVKINAPKTQEILSNKTFEPKETLSKKETKTEQTVVQKVEGSGTININVNITSSGNLADTLMSDRRFKNQLETEILTTMKNKDILMVKKP